MQSIASIVLGFKIVIIMCLSILLNKGPCKWADK